jgi:uncharacterized membrane-anchored protein YhcB (DUF1043 family)
MDKITVTEVYTLFEEIIKRLEKGNKNTTIVQAEMPDFSTVNELTDRLESVIEEVRKPVKTEHRHIIDIASNKIFFGMIGLVISLFICFIVMYFQWESIRSQKDTDLKYRYLKMQGEAKPETLYNLENIFENKRDSVKIIRKQVKQYEKFIIEEAKRLEKMRLKEVEVERLREEMEKAKRTKNK